MEKETVKIEIDTVFEFTLRNKKTLKGKFVKEYIYKGITYLQLQSETGKKHLINPKNAKQL